MPRRFRHCASLCLAAAVAMALCRPHDAAAATIRVMAQPAVQLTTGSQGVLADIEGVVRDPVGRPLASLPLQVIWAGGPAEAPENTVSTDAEGRFQLRRVLPEGTWRVTVRFAGNAYLAQAEASSEIETELVPLGIECDAPHVVPLQALPVPLQCRTTLSGAAWTGTAPEVTSTCADVLVPPAGDDGERGDTWELRPREAGPCLVDVRAPATEFHRATSHTVALRVVDGARVEWSAVPARLPRVLGPRYELRGTVHDISGPVGRARVVVAVGDSETPAETDANGQFAIGVDLKPLRPGQYAAHLRVLSDFPPSAELAVAGPLALERVRGVSELVVALGALVLALVLAIVASAMRLWRTLKPSAAGRRAAGAGATPPTLPEAPAEGVLLVVVDDSVGRRIESAMVEVYGATTDALLLRAAGSLVSLDAGDVAALVRVTAPGYVESTLRDVRLARGSRVVIRMVPVRVLVRDLVHRLLDELSVQQGDARWGRGSVASIRSALRTALRALRRDAPAERVSSVELQRLLDAAFASPASPVAAAEALVLVLDRVWWHPEPDPGDAELAERLASIVRAAVPRGRR